MSLPAPSVAQRIVGDIVDPGTGTPLVGAFVRLFDAQGTFVRAVLTDSAGRFFFITPGPGRFSLTAERIGHASIDAGPWDIADGETRTVHLESAPQAIALEGLEVEGSRRCTVRPDRAEGASRLWEEAKKALEVTIWARDNAPVHFQTTLYIRQLDPLLVRVVHEQAVRSGGAGTKAFLTPPPGTLVEKGFAVADADSVTYYGPDAEILLSDEFLDYHCFELANNAPEPGLVGLSFRPAQQRRLPDIEGTLWMERSTGLLRRIDYRFVSIERLLPVDRVTMPTNAPRHPPVQVTGRTEFRRLDNGVWIVDGWWIRMPVLQRSRGNLILTGWREQGGLVLEARPTGF